MSTPDARTVLLARPGPASDRLRQALLDAGVDLVLELDPTVADVDAVTAANARNLVIAVDADVEDALDRFDPLLADPHYRVLFEEVALVTARDGWDAARWSRHLGAKLLGHGDVLPEGHEPDEAPAAFDQAGAVDDDAIAFGVTDTLPPALEIELSPPVTELSTSPWAEPFDVVETPAAHSAADFATGGESDAAGEAGMEPGPDTAMPWEPVEGEPVTPDASESTFAWEAPKAEPPVDGGTAAGEAAWMRFQDFEAVDELPAANAPQAAETDYRAALSPLEPAAVPLDEAYQRIEQEFREFEGDQPADRWQDFERPVPVQASPPADPPAQTETASETLPSASEWTLSDEPLSTAAPAPTAGNALDRFESRIASLSLVEDEAVDAGSEAPSDVPEAAEPVHEQPSSVEGAVVLLGGLGGPDPLRQLLQHLPEEMSVPVLVQQWLDGGHYDRLVRQMDRATALAVSLATPGEALSPSRVYIVPVGVGLEREGATGLRFSEVQTRGFADLFPALPAAASGAVLLSGTSEDFVEPLLRFQQAGGRVFAQAAEGCYDHTVPALMISRGAEPHVPAGLATQLAARWQQQATA